MGLLGGVVCASWFWQGGRGRRVELGGANEVASRLEHVAFGRVERPLDAAGDGVLSRAVLGRSRVWCV